MSSWFERCRVPAMPSATTADSSASIPARNAMVKADGRTALIFASERSGSDGIGRPAGMAGKREPIVSTGRFSSATAIELATTAIRSEEHTSELQSLMRISYAVFCLKKKKHQTTNKRIEKTEKHKAKL